MMKFTLVLLSVLVSLHFATCDKKKSVAASTPWPGFPFRRPPPNFFQPTPAPDLYYMEYDLGDEEIDDNSIGGDAKSDYKSTGAFDTPLASALHDFTFDLYTDMAGNWPQGENAVISPLSIYTALCMLSAGLGGNSNMQAAKVLHSDAFDNVHGEMERLIETVFDDVREDAIVTSANRIYVDRSIRLLKDFKRTMKTDYQVSAKRVNFRMAPEQNRNRINGFVQKRTHKKIQDLAPAGSVTSATRLFIVNAMYLKAAWKTTFYRTLKGHFKVTPDETLNAQMMIGSGGECFSETNNELDAQVVRLLLKGDLSMVIIMPKTPGNFSLLEDGEGKQRIRRALEYLHQPDILSWPRTCRITMPKFQIDHSADDLIGCLKNLGMTDIFDAGTADLSKMTPSEEPLYVSDMRHKATIEVNENGLEAAAATSIGISARMMPYPVNINQPFLFIVRDDKTGATLFTGKVVRPETK